MGHYFFDTVIGNPPYNENFNHGGNKQYARPLYHHFINLSIKVGEQSLLITPARFLFDAGSTPKQWNHRMLNDPHLSVCDYYPNSMKVFPKTDVKSGISIISYNNDKENEGGGDKNVYSRTLSKVNSSKSSL